MSLKGFEIVDLSKVNSKEIIVKNSEQRAGELHILTADGLDFFEKRLQFSVGEKKLKLKFCREQAKLTHAEAAELLGLTKDGYFKIESGQIMPKLGVALKIAALFKTTVEELFLVC